MKQYIGKKLVKATPMTRLAYNQLRGWELPADENGEDAGYLVEYTDGGQANHPAYTGYISWSPAAVFERAYNIAESRIDRMLIEESELKERITKLSEFVAGDVYLKLHKDEQNLLAAQLSAMTTYYAILAMRLRGAGVNI